MTAPLTPADCDLRDFPRMMIDIPRLRASAFDATPDDAAWRAALNLWMSSWHGDPAASLEDDEGALCKAAGLGRDIRTWRKVKTIALRGWTLCDDGRLYHATVAEFALEAWLEKLAQRLSSGAGNAKRWGSTFDPEPIKAEIAHAAGLLANLNPKSNAIQKASRHMSRPPPAGTPEPSQRDNENVPSGSQGKGREGIEQVSDVPDGTSSPERRKPKAVRLGAPPTDLVERLWKLQPETGGKRKATRPEVAKALASALDRGGTSEEIEAAFAAYYALPDCRRDEGRYAKGAAVLLHDDKWRDFTPAGRLPLDGPPAPTWPGPADIRAAIVAAKDEAFARSYLDPSGWLNGPDRLVLCRNEFAAGKLNGEVPEVLRDHGVRAIVQPNRSAA